jgi:hypothetical protein
MYPGRSINEHAVSFPPRTRYPIDLAQSLLLFLLMCSELGEMIEKAKADMV